MLGLLLSALTDKTLSRRIIQLPEGSGNKQKMGEGCSDEGTDQLDHNEVSDRNAK